MKEIKIWTDGSAIVTGDGLGGSGVYMKYGDGTERMFSKGWRNTKTGRAEIHALLIALSKLENEPTKVTFYMDSEYVQKSILVYLPNWLKNNWMGAAGPVKNRDLWEKVLKEFERLDKVLMQWIHVKGHQANTEDEVVMGNNIADWLASYKNNHPHYEDLPRKDKGEPRLFYFYDAVHKEVYADRVRRHEEDVTVGEWKGGGKEEVRAIWMERRFDIGYGTVFKYIGTDPSTVDRCYYLHRPSRTYFVEERGKEFPGEGKDDVVCIGACLESSEWELYGILNRTNKTLAKTLENYKLRKEIVADNDDLPF